MRLKVALRWVAITTVLMLTRAEALGACPVYELRVAKGLEKGQSLSVRLFGYRQPVHYDDEPMPELQKYLAGELVEGLGTLQRFSSINTISELEPARTDLVLEGVLTEVDEGWRSSPLAPSKERKEITGELFSTEIPARISIRGVIKSTARDNEILVFSCSHRRSAQALPVVGSFVTTGKELVRSAVKDLAEEISGVIVASDREPTRYHFEEEVLSRTNDTAWQSMSVDWRPDGRFVAAAGEDGVIQIWNAQTRTLEAEVSEHSGTVLRVGWNPDGKRLASVSRDKTVRIWEWFEGEPVTRLAVLRGHTDDVLSVAWSPDGRRLASAGKDQTVRLWEADFAGRGTVLAGHKGAVYSVAWSPDGARLASSGEDGSIRIWDAGNGREQAALRGHEGKVWDVAWSPDGMLLASSGQDRVLRVWTAATREEKRVLRVDTHVQGGVAWSPDGSRLLSVERNLVRLWDAASGSEIRTVLMYPCGEKQRIVGPITREISCMGPVSLSPDGTRLAVAGHVTLVRGLYDAGPP